MVAKIHIAHFHAGGAGFHKMFVHHSAHFHAGGGGFPLLRLFGVGCAAISLQGASGCSLTDCAPKRMGRPAAAADPPVLRRPAAATVPTLRRIQKKTSPRVAAAKAARAQHAPMALPLAGVADANMHVPRAPLHGGAHARVSAGVGMDFSRVQHRARAWCDGTLPGLPSPAEATDAPTFGRGPVAVAYCGAGRIYDPKASISVEADLETLSASASLAPVVVRADKVAKEQAECEIEAVHGAVGWLVRSDASRWGPF